MQTKSHTRTEQLLSFMTVMAWIAYIGFLIQVGATVIAYAVSIGKPDAAKNLYKGLDLHELRDYSFWLYTIHVALIVVLTAMKSFVSLLIIKTLSKFNLENPFTMPVARKLEQISYMSLGIWAITFVSNLFTSSLLRIPGAPSKDEISGEFVLMVGVVFIFSQIFRRGVEIQSENDLTV